MAATASSDHGIGGKNSASERPSSVQVCLSYLYFRARCVNDAPFQSPGFYVTFWQMSMYDLVPLQKPTEREVNKITNYLKSVPTRDRDRRTEEHMHAIRKALLDEFVEQIDNRQATQERLAREKNFWFSPGICSMERCDAALTLIRCNATRGGSAFHSALSISTKSTLTHRCGILSKIPEAPTSHWNATVLNIERIQQCE